MVKVIPLLTLIMVLFSGCTGNKGEVGVTFAYGSAELPLEERQKLISLARQAEESGRCVIIKACIDPSKDAEEFVRAQLLRYLKEEKFRDLQQRGKIPPSMNISRLQLLPQDHYSYRHALTGAGENKELTAGDLRLLAQHRAESVKDYLIDFGHLNPSRIITEIHSLKADLEKGGGVETLVSGG